MHDRRMAHGGAGRLTQVVRRVCLRSPPRPCTTTGATPAPGLTRPVADHGAQSIREQAGNSPRRTPPQACPQRLGRIQGEHMRAKFGPPTQRHLGARRTQCQGSRPARHSWIMAPRLPRAGRRAGLFFPLCPVSLFDVSGDASGLSAGAQPPWIESWSCSRSCSRMMRWRSSKIMSVSSSRASGAVQRVVLPDRRLLPPRVES